MFFNNSKNITLTVFSNFFIDNLERLQRMKDSFNSFKEIYPNEWVINIRGKFRQEASLFLKENIGNNLKIYFLNSRYGWFYDSRNIFKEISSNYIMFWIEDHILVNTPDILLKCIEELKLKNLDNLQYSFYNQNLDWIKTFKNTEGKYTYSIKLDNSKENKQHYISSCPSIMSREYFEKILFSKKPFLKNFPRKTPFDFEKKIKDMNLNNFCITIPKDELFASIDDDHGFPQSSLISRGIYKNRFNRIELQTREGNSLVIQFKNKIKNKNFFFKKNLSQY